MRPAPPRTACVRPSLTPSRARGPVSSHLPVEQDQVPRRQAHRGPDRLAAEGRGRHRQRCQGQVLPIQCHQNQPDRGRAEAVREPLHKVAHHRRQPPPHRPRLRISGLAPRRRSEHQRQGFLQELRDADRQGRPAECHRGG